MFFVYLILCPEKWETNYFLNSMNEAIMLGLKIWYQAHALSMKVS